MRSEQSWLESLDSLSRCLWGWALFPVLGRIVGAVMVVVGLAAATSNEPWAGWTIAAGATLWLAGSWLYSMKTSRYSSPLARILFEGTPLKWTLWQHRQARRQAHAWNR